MTANIGSTTVESSTTEITRKPASKTSEHRRITKPIMEKKRRARINNSLNELKALILDALNKDPSRHSKLEKADILEMTVRHLQKLQRQQVAVNIVNDNSVLNKYRAGFSECASEVSRYMNNIDGFDQSFRQRILSHLNHCVNSLNQMAVNSAQFSLTAGQKSAFPGMMPPSPNANTLHVQIPITNGSGSINPQLFVQNLGSLGLNPSSNTPDINNNSRSFHSLNHNDHSDLKNSITTPPFSASSTNSSHFAFNLHSPKTANLPISLTTQDLFFRKHFSSLCSPGSSSFASQMSPTGSDDLEMAVDCTMSKMSEENVWRPW
ncbi:conserved oligomeric Golgi complex subunit 6-like [Sarcoptes scabiei]|nr:conserved oligomeric Golgi complex subunit 6-like [Sarcoptes scabiei]